jgi:D-glycero-D-manno-heptose 1,7-bisphosphate phosphatase
MMAHKAVFLDRDDTIVDDPGYIRSPEQLRLIPGAAEALKQ